MIGDSKIGSFDFQEFFNRFIGEGLLNVGSIMVIFAFITTLFFGRFFCGWLCHFGAVQELGWWILTKFGIQPKTINSRLLTFLPLFILFNFYLLPNIFSLFNSSKGWALSIDLSYPKIWEFLPGVFISLLTFIIDGILIVYLLGRKGFCRFVCPWGAFLKFPAALSVFKVRKTGKCTHCLECTTNCSIGIDVNYEINKFDKVVNSNCTSCMVCIDGCPEDALEYKAINPIKENFRIKDYLFSGQSYSNFKIKNKFFSLRKYDVLIIPVAVLLGLILDGLYSMGHMLSFGISSILTLLLFNKLYSNRFRMILLTCCIIFYTWHGIIKYSMVMGNYHFKNNDYHSVITHIEKVIKYYPKEIGRYHSMLSISYFNIGDFEQSKYYNNKAMNINPSHKNVRDLKNILHQLESYDINSR